MAEIISHDGPVGSMTVKVVPDLTGFTEVVTKAQHALALHAFAVWLSKQGLLNIGGQGWQDAGLSGMVDRYISTTESDT